MKIDKEIKSKFRNEYHRLAVNVLYTHGWLDSIYSQKFKEYGLTSQQFNILRILRGQHPNSATIGLLKERMLEKIPDVSRLVDRLVNKKLIDRNPSVKDRRKVDVTITDKGLELLSEIDKSDSEFDSYLKSLNKKEAATLNTLLDKLRNS